MRTKIPSIAFPLLASHAAVGCIAEDATTTTEPAASVDDDASDDAASGSDGASQPPDTGEDPDPASTTSDGTTEEGDDTGSVFLIRPDGGGIAFECDVWAQDCPAGEKCMPWANDGGSAWNATRCSPIHASPSQVGDPCTVEGSGVSGIDDCELGAMCWDVDNETQMGVCVAFCSGSEANPVCEDPGTSCQILNEGALILCLPSCDPLLQDCSEGQACYVTQGQFSCVPDTSGRSGGFGDACEFLNNCDPGLFCANAASVPDCQSSDGCCTEFCDLSAPDPNMQCTGAAVGQECLPWFAKGEGPPGTETLGACRIPS